MYTYIHIHIHVYVFMYIGMSIYIYTSIDIYIHIYIYTYMYMYLFIKVYISIYTFIWKLGSCWDNLFCNLATLDVSLICRYHHGELHRVALYRVADWQRGVTLVRKKYDQQSSAVAMT